MSQILRSALYRNRQQAIRAGFLGYQRPTLGKLAGILLHQVSAVFFEGVAYESHRIGQIFAAINTLTLFGVEDFPIAVGIAERFMDGTVLRLLGIAIVAEFFAAVLWVIENRVLARSLGDAHDRYGRIRVFQSGQIGLRLSLIHI